MLRKMPGNNGKRRHEMSEEGMEDMGYDHAMDRSDRALLTTVILQPQWKSSAEADSNGSIAVGAACEFWARQDACIGITRARPRAAPGRRKAR